MHSSQSFESGIHRSKKRFWSSHGPRSNDSPLDAIPGSARPNRHGATTSAETWRECLIDAHRSTGLTAFLRQRRSARRYDRAIPGRPRAGYHHARGHLQRDGEFRYRHGLRTVLRSPQTSREYATSSLRAYRGKNRGGTPSGSTADRDDRRHRNILPTLESPIFVV